MNTRLIVDKEGKKLVHKRSIGEMIERGKLVRLCGVHNTISASLAEEAGFEGVWLSSFESHAVCRLPDADILTVSDYAYQCDQITDRISVPLVVDGDAGGGSPINTIRMVREYQKNGSSGICIEDNIYPKRCSFYDGDRQIEEPARHAAKIRAICDNRLSDDFFVIARTEALIAGHAVEDAVARCNMYAMAGADAVLVHHKGKELGPVAEFCEQFRARPIVVVPTTYNQVTEQELRDLGVSMVIYANYGVRSAVKAMQETFKKIAEGGTLSAGNDCVVPMSEIFRLVGVDDLQANEQKYAIRADNI